jgi:hypothetical protein
MRQYTTLVPPILLNAFFCSKKIYYASKRNVITKTSCKRKTLISGFDFRQSTSRLHLKLNNVSENILALELVGLNQRYLFPC